MTETRPATLDKIHFKNISTETKDSFESLGTEIKINKGSILFYEGDASDHLFLIKSGKVRLNKTSSEGKVFFLQMKKKDDLIGALSLFNGLSYHFYAEAISDAVLLRFYRKDVESLLITNSELAVFFMTWLSIENQTILAQFRDLVFCGKAGAVYSILIRLSHEYGKKISSGLLINRKITNQELANYVGATRESINRILKRLMRDNILSVNTKYITIHDMDYLQRHLRCNHCPFEECTI